ncbi:AAA family ATPase [Kitasatospora sp. NPDC085879]|uniref:helix-turn-helix transcriptional regulator n=1 Tax=Kitasatospora sp. NPDC085879 TaxID=3154769 RepID=UPI00342DF5CC
MEEPEVSIDGGHRAQARPTVLVGRADETARLVELQSSAWAGHGASVLLEGEAGIGKSALMNVLAEQCRSAGFRVLHGVGEALERRTPFQAVRSCLGSQHREQQTELAPFTARLMGSSGASGADWEFGVAEAFLAVLDRWCTQGPVALLMDDLDWADASSLLVLGRLQRVLGQMPLLLCAAAQPAAQEDSTAQALRTLRTRWNRILPLPPLGVDETIELLARLTGGTQPGPRLLAYVSAAAGNPLYITEMVAALTTQGRLQNADGIAEINANDGPEPAPLPGSLAEAILGRMADLPAATRELLDAAAVMGPRVSLADLSTVLNIPAMRLWKPVKSAIEAGLLLDDGTCLGFRHALVRQALVENIPCALRGALEQQVGRQLLQAGSPPEQIADYLRRVPLPMDSQTLDRLTEAAPAMVTRSPSAAADVLGRALTEVGADDPHHAPLYLHTVRALLRSAQPTKAEELARRARWTQTSTPQAVELRWLLVQSLYRQGELQQAATEAESTLDILPVDHSACARFHAFTAQCHYFMGDAQNAERSARRATAAGETTRDTYCTAYGLTLTAALRLPETRAAEALELADQALAVLGNQDIDPDLQMAPHFVRGLALTALDRSQEAHRAFDRGLQGCDRGGHDYLTWYHLGKARLHFTGGRWDDALAEIGAGLETVDHFGLSPALRTQAAVIALHRGQPQECIALAENPDESPDSGSYAFLYRWARALGLEAQGKPDQAAQLLFAEGEPGVDSPARRFLTQRLSPDLARLAEAAEDTGRLRGVTEELAALAADGQSADLRAEALYSRGLLEQDPQVLLQAARGFQDSGQLLYEAYAHESAAVLLATHGRTTSARTCLQAAQSLYGQLRAVHDARRAENRLAAVGVRIRRRAQSGASTGWAALTETERAIVGHVADGCSNPDIGARLFLSPRTVQFHLSTIFTKLGITSRVELAVSSRQFEAGAGIRADSATAAC